MLAILAEYSKSRSRLAELWTSVMRKKQVVQDGEKVDGRWMLEGGR